MSDEPKRTVATCPHCRQPVISTLVFGGAEKYCRHCKQAFGMFDVDSVEWTAELQLIIDADRAWFAPIAVRCIAHGMRRRDCPQCEGGEYHRAHASSEAMADSERAYRELLG